MKKLLFISLLLLNLSGCKDNGNKGAKNFEGTRQSEQNENLVFTIDKINDNTYTLHWKGWLEPAKSDGGFSMPGEMHLEGNETLTLNGNQLDMRGAPIVAYVDENTLYIEAGKVKGNCKRK